MAEEFDFEAALKAVQSGQSITGKDGVLGPLVKQLTEAALDSHRVEELAENRKNGKSKKTVKSTSGEFELETPWDRAGTFEPQLMKNTSARSRMNRPGFTGGSLVVEVSTAC